jgi:hypothetical protein
MGHSSTHPARTVAVIGAGSSGIVALKVLADAGHRVTGFEIGQDIGGLWVYENSNGLAAAYRSLHSNTTAASMAYTDLPMPVSYPEYPHRALVVDYLNAYVDAFRLRDKIRFGTTVTALEPIEGSAWDVQAKGPSGTTRERFDAVVVATGHHWDPLWPDPAYPGTFDGTQLHSHDYREPWPFVGKRVLVVGMGNSAMDMAVELSVVADATYISARHGTHILPKYLFGRPLSEFTMHLRWLPYRPRQVILDRLLRLLRGGYARYGLQEPDRGIWQSHPTLSDTLLTRLAHGEILPMRGIAYLDGQSVRFVDGSSIDVDAIIWATGYRITLPFLDQRVLSTANNQIALYKRVFPIALPNISFVGMVQQRGAMMPIAEEQSRLIADHVSGTYRLPTAEVMARDIRDYDAEIGRRYLATQRHTMEVEQGPYIAMLRRERIEGHRRANPRSGRRSLIARVWRASPGAR